MLISKLSGFISKCWSAQVVPMVSGSPGLAKSSVVRQLCDTKRYRMVDIRCSMLEPTDFRGLPYIHEGSVCWGKPSQLPIDDGIVTVLFLDEVQNVKEFERNRFESPSLHGRRAEHFL